MSRFKNPDPTKKTESAEIQSNIPNRFTTQLQEVLDMQLTPESINTFYDQAFSKLIQLAKEVVTQYLELNPNTELTGKDLEDMSFKTYQLQNMDEVLSRLIEIKETLDKVRTLIANKTENIDDIILPPGEGEVITGRGNGGFEDTQIYSRTEMLVYILLNDLKVVPNRIITGVILPNKFRQWSYNIVVIESLNRVVLICDEAKNATYIFDTNLIEGQISIEDFISLTKEDLQEFIESHPGAGIKIIYSKAVWREKILMALNFPINNPTQQQEDDTISNYTIFKNPVGELRPSKHYDLYQDNITGNLWGTTSSIAYAVGRDRTFISGIIDKGLIPALEVRSITSPSRHPLTIYSLEQFENYIDTFADIPVTFKDGPWRNFVQVKGYEGDDGYFGTIAAIQSKLLAEGYNASQALIQHYTELPGIVSVHVMTNKGSRPGYQYSKIREQVLIHEKKPKLSKDHLLTIDGVVYTTIGNAAGQMSISASTLANRAKENQLHYINGLDSVGKDAKLYPLKDLLNLE